MATSTSTPAAEWGNRAGRDLKDDALGGAVVPDLVLKAIIKEGNAALGPAAIVRAHADGSTPAESGEHDASTM